MLSKNADCANLLNFHVKLAECLEMFKTILKQYLLFIFAVNSVYNIRLVIVYLLSTAAHIVH